MIEKNDSMGFIEVDHTADWAIKVWADRLDGLFYQTACGMYALMGIQLAPDQEVNVHFQVSGFDPETFLVSFLAELLYLLERDHTAFEKMEIHFKGSILEADLTGGRVIAQKKEIKAVTYHNLKIRQINGQYETTIVFDV
jgi:SHS2 domain-containing protein